MIQCPTCNGKGCDTLPTETIMVSRLHARFEDLVSGLTKREEDERLVCRDGYMVITDSLSSFCDEEIGMMHQSVMLIESGILPDSGGLSDQNFKAISAINYWRMVEKAKIAEKENS